MKHFLYICIVIICFGLSLIPCVCASSFDYPDPGCSEWAREAKKQIVAVPLKHRYRKTLEQISKACPSIPFDLRDAAKKSLADKKKVNHRILFEAAAPYLDPICTRIDPDTTANNIPRSCIADMTGMPPLRRIDAATFLFAEVLSEEFKKAGIYYRYKGGIIVGYLLLAKSENWEAVE